jgi:membrane protein implicated in regulation of membrane protease activity
MMASIQTTIVALGPWAWIIAGVILFALELVMPGAFMMWLGIAAALVGVISLAVDWAWQWQCVAFAAFALASIPLFRRFALKADPVSEAPLLNRRTEALIGRVFTLEKPIVDGVGTVRIDDTIWRVRGPECPAGSRVKITQADGANLAVEPVMHGERSWADFLAERVGSDAVTQPPIVTA